MGNKSKCLADNLFLFWIKVLENIVLSPNDRQGNWQRVEQVFVLVGERDKRVYQVRQCGMKILDLDSNKVKYNVVAKMY